MTTGRPTSATASTAQAQSSCTAWPPTARGCSTRAARYTQAPWPKRTKWLKRGGYYYLSIPEGGVERGWQTVLRSRSVYGPYERRVVLEQGSTPVNGPHQGALVDTPGGQWWFYHFQSAGPRGRVVHLQPAKWADGWPQIGADLDGNGIGEPVARHAKPATGAAAKPSLPQTSDGFDGTKLYWRGSSRSALMPQWQWCHNPAEGAWSLSERPGWLTLHALRADSLRPCRGMLTQKAMGYGGTATTTVELADSAGGCFAGLLCMGKQFRAVGLCAEGIAVECDGRRTVVARGNFSKARLRVVSDMKANIHRFYYSTDGSDFIPAGGPFAMREGYWEGCAPRPLLLQHAGQRRQRSVRLLRLRGRRAPRRVTGCPPLQGRRGGNDAQQTGSRHAEMAWRLPVSIRLRCVKAPLPARFGSILALKRPAGRRMVHPAHLGVELAHLLGILGGQVVSLARVIPQVVKLQRLVLLHRHALPVSAGCALLARELPVEQAVVRVHLAAVEQRQDVHTVDALRQFVLSPGQGGQRRHHIGEVDYVMQLLHRHPPGLVHYERHADSALRRACPCGR